MFSKKEFAFDSNLRFIGRTNFMLSWVEHEKMPVSVAQLDAPSDWRPGSRGFNHRRFRQHSFVEIDHEIFSTVILSLPLIQEGQLSVSGERMCTILINLHERMLPTSAGVEPATSWSPVGRRIQLSHRGRPAQGFVYRRTDGCHSVGG